MKKFLTVMLVLGGCMLSQAYTVKSKKADSDTRLQEETDSLDEKKSQKSSVKKQQEEKETAGKDDEVMDYSLRLNSSQKAHLMVYCQIQKLRDANRYNGSQFFQQKYKVFADFASGLESKVAVEQESCKQNLETAFRQGNKSLYAALKNRQGFFQNMRFLLAQVKSAYNAKNAASLDQYMQDYVAMEQMARRNSIQLPVRGWLAPSEAAQAMKALNNNSKGK